MATVQIIFDVALIWEHQSLKLASLDKEQLIRELYYKPLSVAWVCFRLDQALVFPTRSHLVIEVRWHTARFVQANRHQPAKGYGVR